MGWVAYSEYRAFGYSRIPDGCFERYIERAGQTASQRTLMRVTKLSLGSNDSIAEMNKKGICEIADIFYEFDNQAPIGEAGAPILSFRNEGYSETYAGSSKEELIKARAERISEAIDIWFTKEQRLRAAVAAETTWRNWGYGRYGFSKGR